MKTYHRLNQSAFTVLAIASAAALVVSPIATFGQDKNVNPASKFYVTDLNGLAQVDLGNTIQDLAKRSVYNAQGTVIETKKAEKEVDQGKVATTMVYSNGTGAYFEHDTRVEVRGFVQEPFTPNRTDMDVEPSISQTRAFVARGTVGLCTSKLVAGSNMTYQTPYAQVNIRGRKVVIESNREMTKISMLEGESTVRGGPADVGGRTLLAGEQAIIRPGVRGGANEIQIQKIPPTESNVLEDKVAQACMAKKTVYFEVKESDKKVAQGDAPAETAASTAQTESAKSETEGAPVAAFDGTRISAFDGNSAPGTSVPGSIQTVGNGVIVAVPVVPNDLPVQFTVSPAKIITPRPGGG